MINRRTVLGVVLGFSILVLVCCVLVPRSTYASINSQINFQGKLTNADGTNVTNGAYSIRFRIYNHATNDAANTCSANSCLWEETQGSVSVTDGIFQVALGSVTGLPGSVDFNSSPLYLGVKVSTDAEMTPRIQFTAAPYAFNSDKLNGLASSAFGQLANNQTWTGTNTLQPTTNITSAIIKQTSVGSPTADILNVQTANSTSILQITGPAANEAAVTLNSVGATRALTLDSGSGTIVLGTNTTTLQKSGTAFTYDINNASDSTLTITNAGTGVASLSVEGDVNIGSGRAYKINGTQITSAALSNDSNLAKLSANQSFSGANNFNEGTGVGQSITATAASTVDQLSVTNSGQASATSGVDGISVTFGSSNASGDALHVAPTYAGGVTDALTYNGLEFDAFSPTNASGTDTVNGIKLGTLTDPGASITSTAVNIGSGWDTLIGGTTAGTNLLGFTNFTVTTAGALTSVGVNSGTGLVQGTGGLTVTGTTNINATGSSATNIGNSTGALTVASGSTSAWANTSGNLTISTVTSGTLALTSAGALNLTGVAASTWSTTGSSSTIVIRSGATTANTALTIDTNAVAGGSGGLTVTTGNASGGVSGANNISTGTGTTATGIIALLTGNASAGTAGNISLDVGTSSTSNGSILIGNAARTQTVTIGNQTSGTTLNLQSGSGNINLSPSAGNDVVFSQGAGSNLQLTASAAPTISQLAVTNAGQGVTTANINGVGINYVGGAAAVEAAGQRIDVTGGTTAGAGAVWSGLRVVQGTITAGTTVNDVKLETAALTQTTVNTTNINGLTLPTAGALGTTTVGAGNTINWNGLNVTTPTNTPNFAASSITSSGLQITTGAVTQTAGTATSNGALINLGTLTTGGTQNGVNFGAIAAPAVGLQDGLFFGTGWSSSNVTANDGANIANIAITQSTAGNRANNFTIKNNNATPRNLLEVRDLTANSNQFGSLAIADAFISRQSYFGEEFTNFRSVNCTDGTFTANSTHNSSRGTGSPLNTACGTGVDLNNGPISTSAVATVSNAANTCTYASGAAASNLNGYERITPNNGSTNTISCMEYNGAGADATPNNLFNTGNFPQIVMKARMSAAGANQKSFIGISNISTAKANPAVTDKGIYFTNCSAPTTPTCVGTGWYGAVQDGTNAANVVTCPTSGFALNTRFSYLRIEMRKDTSTTGIEVEFFVDNDVGDGISEVSCGAITSTTNAMGNTAMSMLALATETGASVSTHNLDIDYFRVWQDDAPGGHQASTTTPTTASQKFAPPGASAQDIDSAVVTMPKVVAATTNAKLNQSSRLPSLLMIFGVGLLLALLYRNYLAQREIKRLSNPNHIAAVMTSLLHNRRAAAKQQPRIDDIKKLKS